ncbi:MAG: aldo/keto reductase [Promethearchaeota archaeon]
MIKINTSETDGQDLGESITGDVIAKFNRDDLFLTGNLSPWHIRYKNMKKAVRESLRRLGIEYFDLYLISGSNLLMENKKSLRFLEELVEKGTTRYIGVRNFSVSRFKRAQKRLKKYELINNQIKARIDFPNHIHTSLVYYQKKGITTTIYNPTNDFKNTGINWDYREIVTHIAEEHNSTIQQISIAWLINQLNVITLMSPLQISQLGDVESVIDIRLNKKEIDTIYKFEDMVEVESSQWI